MTQSSLLSTYRLVLVFLLVLVSANTVADTASRMFSFEYKTHIDMATAAAGPVHVFIPLAVDNAQQRIVNESIQASIPGSVEVEDRYGNRFWHGSIDQSAGEAIDITVQTTVERLASSVESPRLSRLINAEEKAAMAIFLGENDKVLVGHPILKPILQEVESMAGSDDPAKVSRAIYDWVVDNVEYKKIGSGWGNGDTFWACNERYGNCTDFHALLISLARSENIPARFEIGFPVPDSRDAGSIAGYHCWVQVYLPDIGWFPIDASEAFKHPENKEYFYGTHPQDRIHFSTGRDLRLGLGHRDKALNYFVYPHVEVAGKLYDGPIDSHFSYQNVPIAPSHLAGY